MYDISNNKSQLSSIYLILRQLFKLLNLELRKLYF